MSKIGEVQRMHTFTFDDGDFTFHTAIAAGGSDEIGTVFRVRADVWPSIVAAAKGIEYKLMLNSTALQIAQWLESHPEHEVRKVVETDGIWN